MIKNNDLKNPDMIKVVNFLFKLEIQNFSRINKNIKFNKFPVFQND